MVRSLCFVLLAVNFFGLVKSNNNCVFDMTDCRNGFSRFVKRSRGCDQVTTPTLYETRKSSNICKNMEYSVHISNKATTSFGSKECRRTYLICRGKEQPPTTQPPTPVQTCTVNQVTGEWKKLRTISRQSTTTTTVTVGTATTKGSTVGEQYTESIGVKMSAGFQVGGFSSGVEVSKETGQTLYEENKEDITKTTTVQRETTVPDVQAMVGRAEWQFVISSTGKCGNALKTTESSLPSLAYSKSDRAPCCLPGAILDGDRYASCICSPGSKISTASHCVVDEGTSSEDSAKKAVTRCNGWGLSMLPKQSSDTEWNDVAVDCCLTQAEVTALKIFVDRCQRCPNGCTQTSSFMQVGTCDKVKIDKKKTEQLTFGGTACCCPLGFTTDCTGTRLRTATNTSTENHLSSAESASKTLFSCSVLVFILHLLL